MELQRDPVELPVLQRWLILCGAWKIFSLMRADSLPAESTILQFRGDLSILFGRKKSLKL